jgi:hypothetical protein
MEKPIFLFFSLFFFFSPRNSPYDTLYRKLAFLNKNVLWSANEGDPLTPSNKSALITDQSAFRPLASSIFYSHGKMKLRAVNKMSVLKADHSSSRLSPKKWFLQRTWLCHEVFNKPFVIYDFLSFSLIWILTLISTNETGCK